MEKVVSTSVKAALFSPDLMTNDRITALTKGHGGLNLAALCAANAIASELLAGKSIRIIDLNAPEIEAETVIRRGVEAAKLAGAVPANAALLTAALTYIAGANVRAGCPAANRKLGACARIIAGADKGGVLLIPTAKSTNKVSAFAAVHAIYHAMMDGKLTRVEGARLPDGVGGSPLYGHGALGEDIVFPELTENAARIGTEAMLKAYSGAGMKPSPFLAAVLATAATMEIVHPDADVAEKYGEWRKVSTADLAGRSAAKTARLPVKLHFRGTGEEFNTAKLVGDIGLMLKDVGTPTVVGMIAFDEIFACFEESGSIGLGSSGGPLCPPLAHLIADGTIALRVLAKTQSMEEAINAIRKNKEMFIDPEIATVASNIIARKTEQILPGPVTEAIIHATEEGTALAVTRRAEKAFLGLSAGKSLADVVRALDLERVKKVEARAAGMFGQMLGKKISINVKKIEGGARRKGDFVKKYYGFDIDADVEVTVDGHKILFEGLSDKVVPDAMLKTLSRLHPRTQAIPLAAIPIIELMLSASTIINITVPVAVACAMKKMSPKEAARKAEEAAFITAAIPGAKSRARKVGEIALKILGET